MWQIVRLSRWESERMKFKELAEYCKELGDCDDCEHKKECEHFTERLENISPIGLMNFISENENL